MTASLPEKSRTQTLADEMGVKENSISNVYMCIPFTRYAVITVSLPAISLLYCFVSAFFFRGKEILDTDCNVLQRLQVTNNIPSVSAVTGIRPQAYVWRICIGLHSTPRFFVGFVFYNYYLQSLPYIKRYQGLYKFINKLCFWLYTIECSCLLAVSCISNKENYPIHEKIFVCFMVTSVAYMLFGTILFKWSKYKPMTEREKRSYFWKRVMFVWICISTVGLLISFVRHRIYCIPGAFSIFSVFEYMIAYANMGYHLTAYFEFSDKHLIAANLHQLHTTNGTGTKTLKNGRRKVD